jgi:hypothetical protein
MTAYQAFTFGLMVALTPSLMVLAYLACCAPLLYTEND